MSGLTLNLLEIHFNKDKLSILCARYSDDLWEKVKDLRDSYGFYRFGDSFYAWPITEKHQPLLSDFSQIEINFSENPFVFNKILEKSVVNLFWESEYKIFKNDFSSTWDMPLKKAEIVKFGALELIPHMNISFQALDSKKSNKQIITISLRKRFRPNFIFTEDKFKEIHIDTRDWDRDTNGNIKSTQNNIDEYLNASGQWEKYTALNRELYSDKNGYDEFYSFYKKLDSIKNKLYFPDSLLINEISLNHIPNSNFGFESIRKPTYFYFNERTTQGRVFYDQALKDLRPYSFANFQNKIIKILVLTRREHEGTTDSFAKRIEEKLKQIFHTPKVEFNIVIIENHGGYIEALNQADLSDITLAIVVLSEDDKLAAINDSIYYLTKAKLLNLGIPTQDITIEKIKQRNIIIENAITLNIYAKIGGVGWTIEQDVKNKTELIIGVGTSIDENNNKTVGFANIFDYRGAYLLGDCSQISTKENYVGDLEKHLTQSIQKVLEVKSTPLHSSIRLIFHLRKEAGVETEIYAIEKALENFKDYDIQFAIVHLSIDHNYKLFSDQGNQKVFRGTYIQLTSNLALLHLGGNTSTPLLIRLDNRSTYKDITDLTKQVLFFCHLSQRSFIPANMPVTIKYPSIMAKLTSNLSKINQWDISQLNRIKEKLWFL